MSAKLLKFEPFAEDRKARRKRWLSPETAMRRLLREEAAAERQLLTVRAALMTERRRYAKKHRLQILPSLDTVRRLFGCGR